MCVVPVDSLIEPLIEPLTQTTILERNSDAIGAKTIGIGTAIGTGIGTGSRSNRDLGVAGALGGDCTALELTVDDGAVLMKRLNDSFTLIDAPNKREKWGSSSMLDANEIGRRRRRSVRFESDAKLVQVVGYVPHRSGWTDFERQELFWTPFDLKHIRDAAKNIAKYYRNSSTNHRGGTCQRALYALDQVYQACFTAQPHDVDDHDESDYASASWQRYLYNETDQMDRYATPLVLYWCRSSGTSDNHASCCLGDDRFAEIQPLGRGLERYCSVRQRTERSEWTFRCRRAILQLDQHQRQRLGENRHPQYHDADADALAQVYRQYSRSSVLFARILGHADELAAEQAVLSPAIPFATLPIPQPMDAASNLYHQNHHYHVESSAPLYHYLLQQQQLQEDKVQNAFPRHQQQNIIKDRHRCEKDGWTTPGSNQTPLSPPGLPSYHFLSRPPSLSSQPASHNQTVATLSTFVTSPHALSPALQYQPLSSKQTTSYASKHTRLVDCGSVPTPNHVVAHAS